MKSAQIVKTGSQFSSIVLLAVIAALLLGYQYMGAAWSEPTTTAPGGNVDAPLNVGTTDQVKNAALGVDALAVFGDVSITGTSNLAQVNATQYCDETGANCFTSSAVGGGGGAANPADVAFAQQGITPGVTFPSSYICDDGSTVTMWYMEYITSTGNIQYRPMGSGIQWWTSSGSHSTGYSCDPSDAGREMSIQEICDAGLCFY